MVKKSLPVATVLLVGAFTLAACGNENDDDTSSDMPGMSASSHSMMSSSESATSDFNDADVTFATDMISHHRQAVEMAELAVDRAGSPEVKDLAERIEQAQGPEIDTMSEWLHAWGQPVPEEMGGMDMSGSMPGMMSTEDMKMLAGLSGARFDQKFLQMMIAHHQGAIEMARTEQSDGENADAKALAEQIERAQTDEIATMRDLLG